MIHPALHKRLLVALFATLQLILPVFAGASMCSLGLASEDCCCEPQPAAEPMGCCSSSEHESEPTDQPTWQQVEGGCECARTPEPTPLQFPEMPDTQESNGLHIAWFQIPVALQPQPRAPVAYRLPRVWPPGKERAASVLFQVFRL